MCLQKKSWKENFLISFQAIWDPACEYYHVQWPLKYTVLSEGMERRKLFFFYSAKVEYKFDKF